jgi:predicted RNase H-like HicB family nuclease
VTFTITLTPDEDGVVVAECPAIPGCVSQGRTDAEAEANIRLAIRECLAARAELGLPLVVVTKQIDVPA